MNKINDFKCEKIARNINDYYRLDRPDEVANHPLFQSNEKKAFVFTEHPASVKWETSN